MSDKPLSRYPFIEIHDWEQHQPPEARNGNVAFIRNWVRLVANHKYLSLTLAERGMLHGLWLLRGIHATDPPRDPDKLRTVLHLPRNRYIWDTLEVLERKGFIHFRARQRRGDKRREEKNPPTPRRAGERKSFPKGFTRFWEAYPLKVGKQAAAASWKRQKLEARTGESALHRLRIIEAVQAQITSEAWTKDAGQFIPHPATWLNQGRWDDEATHESPPTMPHTGLYDFEKRGREPGTGQRP